MCALAGALVVSSCKKEDLGPAPKSLDAASFKVESRVGNVKITWDKPEAPDYQTIKFTYTHPDTKKEHVRLASAYSDSIVVDGLFKRLGMIDFTVRPVSKTGVEGASFKIQGESLVVPKVLKVDLDSKFKETFEPEKSLFVSTLQQGEGSLAELIDGKANTYYHGQWSGGGNGPMPHYIVVKLAKPARAIQLFMKARHNKAADAPKEFNILGSKTFDKADVKNPAKHNAVKVRAYTAGPENANGAEWTSEPIMMEEAYNYIWIEVVTLHSNKNFPTLAELAVWSYSLQIFDPETGEITKS